MIAEALILAAGARLVRACAYAAYQHVRRCDVMLAEDVLARCPGCACCRPLPRAIVRGRRVRGRSTTRALLMPLPHEVGETCGCGLCAHLAELLQRARGLPPRPAPTSYPSAGQKQRR